jgi:hypothetical protein
MNTSTAESLPLGTTAHYATMHKWLQRALLVCLTVLVLEASFTLPGLLIWFGWPTLSLVQVCDELMKVRYSDDNAQCLVPQPLFIASEGQAYKKSAQDDWGIQPRPRYKRIGYRDLVRFRDERLAREAAAAQHRGQLVPASADTTPAEPASPTH